MRSIMLTYPGFQSLPQGLKKLLLASETFFFSEAHVPAPGPGLWEVPAPQWVVPYAAALSSRWHPVAGPTWRN